MTADIERFEKRAEIIRAMGSAARLVLVEELSSGDKTVSALTELVDLDISTISRHLLVLRNAGIVTSRRDGNRMIYHLRTPCVLSFMSCVEKVIDYEKQQQENEVKCEKCE